MQNQLVEAALGLASKDPHVFFEKRSKERLFVLAAAFKDKASPDA